jgi:hypothetical protein
VTVALACEATCAKELGRDGSTKLQLTSAGRRPWRQGEKERSAPASPPNRLLGPTRPGDVCTGVGARQDVRGGEEVACASRRSAGHRGAGPRRGRDVALTPTCAMRGGQQASRDSAGQRGAAAGCGRPRPGQDGPARLA